MYRDHRDKGYPDESTANYEPPKIEGIVVRKQSSRALIEINEERDKQDRKWGEQNHPVSEQPDHSWSGLLPPEKEKLARQRCQARQASGTLSWVDICQEELQEVNGAEDEEHAREELIQLAACCVAAIECIDRRAAKKHDVKTCEDRNCLHPTCVAINGG